MSRNKTFSLFWRSASLFVLLGASVAYAQQPGNGRREFPPGLLKRIDQLPASRLRARIEQLPPPAQERALAVLNSFHFTDSDLGSMNADPEGEIFYEDHFTIEPQAADLQPEPEIAEAAVPVNPFPASLLLHSRPGAPNVLYLNFRGENVTGTSWNTSLGRSSIPAVPFSSDSDYSTFNDAEQAAIRKIWQRVAEDYAPFNIDVTTERPATFGARTAHALITRNTDSNGSSNPSSESGGVAYINVFGTSSFPTRSPGWIYANNLGHSESSIAEAVSHEIGHNLGLSHDGKSDGTSYYGGHGSGSTSWGPIMGTGYGRNVSQWSKGDYYLANNTQDDLAVIASKISYRIDDHSDNPNSATILSITGTNFTSTTPESDHANTNRLNKGVLERNTDVDIFRFESGGGAIDLRVNPWRNSSGTFGGNLDLLVELRNDTGTVLASDDSSAETTAEIRTTVAQGTYYLYIRNAGVGDPLSYPPNGYTSYGSLGQYFVSGYIAPVSAAPSAFFLNTSVNNANWGTVSPQSAMFPAGASVQIQATPARYYRFVGWTNGGSNNPLLVTMNTNVGVQATFTELLTVNRSIPHWWLGSFGYTNNLETVVNSIGANGIPIWQSYIAGLNPTDPQSTLRLSVKRGVTAGSSVLTWNTVTGRVYTIWASTNAARPFTPLTGASNLPPTIQSFTNVVSPGRPAAFYRIEARKP